MRRSSAESLVGAYIRSVWAFQVAALSLDCCRKNESAFAPIQLQNRQARVQNWAEAGLTPRLMMPRPLVCGWNERQVGWHTEFANGLDQMISNWTVNSSLFCSLLAL